MSSTVQRLRKQKYGPDYVEHIGIIYNYVCLIYFII